MSYSLELEICIAKGVGHVVSYASDIIEWVLVKDVYDGLIIFTYVTMAE